MRRLIAISGWVVALLAVLLVLDLRYWHVLGSGTEPGPGPVPAPAVPVLAPPAAPPTSLSVPNPTNQPSAITMVCRAVSLERVAPGADSRLAYDLRDELKKSALISDVQLSPDLKPDSTSGTFDFTVTLVMKRPLPLSSK